MVREGTVEAFATLEEFLARVCAHFVPLDSKQTGRDKLAKLVQTGSVAAYSEIFLRTVLSILGITEDEKVDRFTRGLKPAAQREVWLRDCQTLEEAMRVASRVDATYRAYGRGRTFNEADGHTPMELGQTQEFRGQCYSCNQYGHRAADCPTAPACGRGRGRGRGRAQPAGRQVYQIGEAGV